MLGEYGYLFYIPSACMAFMLTVCLIKFTTNYLIDEYPSPFWYTCQNYHSSPLRLTISVYIEQFEISVDYIPPEQNQMNIAINEINQWQKQ